MKIKVRTLRKMIQEAIVEATPQTRRGGAGVLAPRADDLEPAVPTQRGIGGRHHGDAPVSKQGPKTQFGMGLEPPIDDLFGGWNDHVATSVDTSALDAKTCADCGKPMPVGAVACPNCDAMSRGPMTMRSPGIAEMKLGLFSGQGMGHGEFTPDSLFDDVPFERDTKSDMDDEFALDHDEELVLGGKGIQTAKLPDRR